MKKKTSSTPFTRQAFLFLFLFVLTFLLNLMACQPSNNKELPFLGVHDIREVSSAGGTDWDTSYYQIPAFELIDQDSLPMTEAALKDKVYVGYFFFTSCPATCPVMTSAMQRVYKVVGNEPGFAIVAHTIDPKRDTPQKLKQFAQKNEVVHPNWHFLTGDKDYIYDLGLKGYYLSMGQNDAAPGGFIHSSKFMLIDRDRHIRGIYEGTDANEVAQMIRDIKQLLHS